MCPHNIFSAGNHGLYNDNNNILKILTGLHESNSKALIFLLSKNNLGALKNILL